MDRLIESIEAKVPLTESDKMIICSFFEPYTLKKKKDILRIGEVCKYTTFIDKGCARSFSIDSKGAEKTIQIAFEGHWIADMYSVLTGEPSDIFIETIEDVRLFRIKNEDIEKLYDQVPAVERYFRLLLQNAYVATQRRLKTMISEPADVRYQQLIRHYPDMLKRVPLAHIASYLGIAPESLSRIRKKPYDSCI